MLHTQSTGLGDVSALLAKGTQVHDTHTKSGLFWALDPRLPRIAAMAAVEFDWLIQAAQRPAKAKPSVSHKSINGLWSLLSDSPGETPHSVESRAFHDSLGLHFFAQAYNHIPHPPVTTREDLLPAVTELTEALHKAHEGKALDQDVLEKLKAFCIGLSRYASAYRKMIYDNRPEHPYRK